MAAALNERLGRYQLLERLGKGGMGEVYLARHAGPMGVARFVALKRVLAERIDHDDPDDVAKVGHMFVDEMRLAVRLTHPNIISVYDFGVEAGSHYLVMEFVQGVDAYQILKRASMRGHDTTDVACALHLAAEVARGLDYVHKLDDGQGRPLEIVHRDVTPANILVSYNGHVKLADFGVARATHQFRQTRTETGELKGKIRYMSPEQARGQKLDHRSDLFSLGTVLLELFTLKPAFSGESEIESLMQVQKGVPSDWESRTRSVPADVAELLLRIMAPERDARFADGAAVAEAAELLLRRRDPGFGPPKLAAYLTSLFAREKDALRDRMSGYESGAGEPPATPRPLRRARRQRERRAAAIP